MTQQEQFLNVVDRDTAEQRFQAALALRPLGEESIPLDQALGRVLSRDVIAEVDVPAFDRSNLDGFAVRSSDTFEASEERPHRLLLLPEVLATGVVPSAQVQPGSAISIATGGMLPRGADAVVMVEHADIRGNEVCVSKAVAAGTGVSFCGTDIASGETVLRQGELLTSRETGVLAAIGQASVHVWRRPRVAILSTGDELIPPGEPIRPAGVFDSNAQTLADAVRELGGEPFMLGIVPDEAEALRGRLRSAIDSADCVLLSGGTSKGAGDLSYRVVADLSDPGIVAHGVALKPGKPICLAVTGGKPVVILPGFPTSAIFTFHEFVAPVLRAFGARPRDHRSVVRARLAVRTNSEIGRTEYLLVGLIRSLHGQHKDAPELLAYPMGKGSGSVTSFARADGFITIGRHEEIVEAAAPVDVQLLGRELRMADLVVIGSHCIGLDYLLGEVQKQGVQTKFLAVGSTAGLDAVARGQCDVAGIHLLDPVSGEYNRPLLPSGVELIPGYRRMQGVVYRREDRRFHTCTGEEAVARAKDDPSCVMVNRNKGSGTRILIDRLLGESRPAGYAVQPRTHNAVAAAVLQNRADWGIAIESVVRNDALGFLPLSEEHYDFAVSSQRVNQPAIQAFRELLNSEDTRERLKALGLRSY
jgi:putative molybdopterin biosynthesis protein